MDKRQFSFAVAAVTASLVAVPALAQKKYDTGANDKEIVIGNIMPYSGPASAYGTIGKAAGAYFDKVNAEGGINGRKIRYISLDDGYSPPKTVEQARKLVEQEEVLLIYQSLGTPTNSAIHRYMNQLMAVFADPHSAANPGNRRLITEAGEKLRSHVTRVEHLQAAALTEEARQELAELIARTGCTISRVEAFEYTPGVRIGSALIAVRS